MWEENWDYVHKTNGGRYAIRFQGYNANPGQYEIVDTELNELKGDPDAPLTFIKETLIDYGKNVFYDAIPFETLRTFETNPQVIVTVDGLPAVCHNLNCDFNYVVSPGEVTAFTFDETTKVLTITGTKLPVGENLEKIEFSLSSCTVDAAASSETSIKCTLDN